MKQFISLILFLLTAPQALGMVSSSDNARFSALKQEFDVAEKMFNNILQEELIKPDESRWRRLKPLFDKVGCFMSVQQDFALQLVDLADDKKATYQKWRALLEIHHPIVKTINEQAKAAQEPLQADQVPNQAELSPLDASTQTQAPLQQPTIAKKKNKKKKKKGTNGNQSSSGVANAAKPARKQALTATERATLNLEFAAALLTKQYNEVESLLAQHKDTIRIQDLIAQSQFIPLHFAAFIGDGKLTAILLKYNADVHQSCWIQLPSSNSKVMLTALAMAVSSADIESAQLLLKHNADPNVIIKTKPLTNFQFILDVAAAQIQSDESKYTPQLQSEMIMLLLAHGARKMKGKFICWDELSKHGWPIDLSDQKNKNFIPLVLTATKEITVLNGDIYAIVAQESLPGLLAHEQGLLKRATVVLQDLPSCNKNLETIFWKVLDEGSPAMLEKFLMLTQGNLNLNVPHDQNGLLPLQYCAQQGLAEQSKLLIKQGANPNSIIRVVERRSVQCIFQVCPLTLAIIGGHVDCVRQLLASGANPNIELVHQPGNCKETPLSCVTQKDWTKSNNRTPESRQEIIKILLQSGATDFSGKVFLHDAEKKLWFPMDLFDKDDQIMIQWILAQENGAQCISSNNGNIILTYKTQFKAPALLTTETNEISH